RRGSDTGLRRLLAFGGAAGRQAGPRRPGLAGRAPLLARRPVARERAGLAQRTIRADRVRRRERVVEGRPLSPIETLGFADLEALLSLRAAHEVVAHLFEDHVAARDVEV